MNDDNPTCGVCNKVMTPENSTAAPEYFLCDDCAVKRGFARRVRHEPTATELQLLRTENASLKNELERQRKEGALILQEHKTELDAAWHRGMTEAADIVNGFEARDIYEVIIAARDARPLGNPAQASARRCAQKVEQTAAPPTAGENPAFPEK